MKKQNLSSDKAQWQCWEVLVRTEKQDVIVTVMRRKYIPPLMEIFQDIILYSTFDYLDEEPLKENEKGLQVRNLQNYLKEAHQLCADSIYSTQRFNAIYKNIVIERANSLLMDEETMNYYQCNLNIQPYGIGFAHSYLKCIL
mmetsp:Transcript_8002/g.7498  ORF Transcript_8002/g.7498 Transcript_8002/m.7498 type:complete len:142 (+) Transcript_8002:680-1105(+)